MGLTSFRSQGRGAVNAALVAWLRQAALPLDQASLDRAESLHQARLALKRVRAWVRLLRTADAAAPFPGLETVREVAQAYGRARDWHIAASWIARRTAVAGEATRNGCDGLAELAAAWEGRARIEEQRLCGGAKGLTVPRARLLHTAHAWDRVAGAGLAPKALRRAFRRRLAGLRRDLRGITRRASAEAFHQLRRRTKDIHLLGLDARGRSLVPAGLPRKRLRRLEQLLGAEHDRTVVLLRLRSDPWLQRRPKLLRALAAQAREERRALRRQAVALARPLARRLPSGL